MAGYTSIGIRLGEEDTIQVFTYDDAQPILILGDRARLTVDTDTDPSKAAAISARLRQAIGEYDDALTTHVARLLGEQGR